jgi:hypothetical protein
MEVADQGIEKNEFGHQKHLRMPVTKPKALSKLQEEALSLGISRDLVLEVTSLELQALISDAKEVSTDHGLKWKKDPLTCMQMLRRGTLDEICDELKEESGVAKTLASKGHVMLKIRETVKELSVQPLGMSRHKDVKMMDFWKHPDFVNWVEKEINQKSHPRMRCLKTYLRLCTGYYQRQLQEEMMENKGYVLRDPKEKGPLEKMKKELEESDDEEEKIPVPTETKKDPNLYDMPKPNPVTPCFDSNGKVVNRAQMRWYEGEMKSWLAQEARKARNLAKAMKKPEEIPIHTDEEEFLSDSAPPSKRTTEMSDSQHSANSWMELGEKRKGSTSKSSKD